MSKVVLVTGASQGIGAAVALMAGHQGWKVALSYRNGADGAESTAAAIRAAGGQAKAFKADVSDEAATVALFAAIDTELGPVTALVNNAGITGGIRTLDQVDTAMLNELMAINVNGCFLALREAIKRMATDLGGPGGAVVNIGSRASGIGGGGEWVHYAASKGAVDSFTIGAAKELAPRGIRVNAVHPGLIDTEIHAKAGKPNRVKEMGSMIPLGRAGTPEDVANVVMWLLGDGASYVTGALIPVSGGR